MDKQLITGVILASFAITASGCLIVSGKSIDQSGIRISQATMNQIEIGRTTEQWIVAALGEPSYRAEVGGDKDIVLLRYEYREKRSEGGVVFLIFAGGSETTKRTTTYFEFTDGYLSRTWKEHDSASHPVSVFDRDDDYEDDYDID